MAWAARCAARAREADGASLDRARLLLAALGINAVPMAGVFVAGWDGATALTIYWWENLAGSLLVALRLLLHRRLTRKRGYGRLHLTLASRDGKGAPPGSSQLRPGSFVQEFAVAACAATVVHGLLLWFVVSRVFASDADGDALRIGVLGVAGIQLLSFLFGLRRLRERPFAEMREQGQMALNRVTLLHLVLIVGTWVSLKSGWGNFFGVFVVLKLLADVGNAMARAGVRLDSDEPRWLYWLMGRIASKGPSFPDYWRKLKAEQRRLEEQDEEEQRARRR